MAKKNSKSLPVSTGIPVEAYTKASPFMKKEAEERERRYRAEDALRDLQRAECHKKDKKLMSDVKKIADEQMKALSKLKGI